MRRIFSKIWLVLLTLLLIPYLIFQIFIDNQQTLKAIHHRKRIDRFEHYEAAAAAAVQRVPHDGVEKTKLSKLLRSFEKLLNSKNEFAKFREESIRYYGDQSNVHKMFIRLLQSDQPSLRIAIIGGSISVPRGVKVIDQIHCKKKYLLALFFHS